MTTAESKTEQSVGLLDGLKSVGFLFLLGFVLIMIIGLASKSAGMAVLMVGGVIIYYLDRLVAILEKINKTLKE